MKRLSVALISFLAAVLIIGCGKEDNMRQRWTVEQANAWASSTGWLRGSNFTPSTAINQLEFWQKETFDPATIDRELGFAESIGFNVMRVFLHHKAWLQDKEGFKDRMGQYLAIADKHKIKTMFVFFDDCWNGTSAVGKQPAPKIGIHNSGWLQDPGQKESSDSANFPVLESYLKDIMNHFARDNRIVLWDLYNEPGNSGKGDSSLNLLEHAFAWARGTPATQPLTSAAWMDTTSNVTRRQLELSDVISFHHYGPDSAMRDAIVRFKRQGRPLVCSEYMARKFGSTFQSILPILHQENVGAINWGLVKGKTNTIYAWDDTTHPDGSEPAVWFHDIFRPDGSVFSEEEIDVIKRECLGK